MYRIDIDDQVLGNTMYSALLTTDVRDRWGRLMGGRAVVSRHYQEWISPATPYRVSVLRTRNGEPKQAMHDYYCATVAEGLQMASDKLRAIGKAIERLAAKNGGVYPK